MTLRTAKAIIRRNYSERRMSARTYLRHAGNILLVREWARAELVTAAETIMRDALARAVQ